MKYRCLDFPSSCTILCTVWEKQIPISLTAPSHSYRSRSIKLVMASMTLCSINLQLSINPFPPFLAISIYEDKDDPESIPVYLSVLFMPTSLIAQATTMAMSILSVNFPSPICSPCSYIPSRRRNAQLPNERSRRACSAQFTVSLLCT